MSFSNWIFLVTVLFLFLTIFVNEGWKGSMAALGVLVNAGLSSFIAIKVFCGQPCQENIYGGYIFGNIPVRVDALAAWFILLTNFTLLTGILYGRRYMKQYKGQRANLSLHFVSYIVIHFSMIGIFCVQNFLAFLCVWEMMAICSFLLVIFEHHKIETIKAGINYLVQAHIGIVFLMIGFIWIHFHTGSYDFNAITQYSSAVTHAVSFVLFSCFFIGFGIKAGFVPFHTWLPYAHPAAPAHISGIMSGVIIKLGIFGILRMLLLIKGNYLVMGYTVLIISVISGVYGVMLAIVQHNVKKLLAYHSIENIGIIGIGIGLGAIGIGMHNSYLAFAGFAGALLHTLNHSLFKSLLFYCAGTVYQATHTMDIEHLGGLIRKMPHTAFLFLVAALAICGLPPFNGFISEFLIYSGLFHAIHLDKLSLAMNMIVSICGLVLIGGLALLCFTKAFGVIFLGTERHPHQAQVQEAEFSKLFPKYLVAVLIILIGIVPQFFVGVIEKPLALFTSGLPADASVSAFISTLQKISISVAGLILLSALTFLVRKKITASKNISSAPTWGCGYVAPTPKLQYTANSFVRSYRKLVKPVLMMNKKETEMKGIFPEPVHTVTHPYDRMEALLIDTPIRYLKGFMRRFRFLQNGNPQFYILYGVIFIFIAIVIPLLLNVAHYIIQLFKQI
ncbi:MAG: hypothetical protein HY064_01430 [Bacteroidetes bacterium]|nr:hypothetical protein [Bacteroidota bacterium]